MKADLYQLVKDKARIETILDFLPYPFVIAEFRFGTYRLIYLNKKFTEEIGYSLEEIPTIEEWFERAYPDAKYRSEVIAAWSKILDDAKRRGEDSALLQVIIHTKINGDKWYEVKASYSGPLQLVAFVCLEEARAKEKELTRLNENKNRTLSILAHDLRVPITNLQSLTNLLLTEKLSQPEFFSQASQLHTKSTQVLEFIDTTLYWTKANFDALQLKREEVQLTEIIHKILSLYEGAYKAKQLQIALHVNGENVYADSEVLTILLRNLISNAIKFTPDGGTITIQLNREKKSFRISVRDTGVGMNQSVIEKIRNDTYSSTHGTREEKGLGIGLKLCHQLVKKINGEITIESDPGKGTEVNLIFNS